MQVFYGSELSNSGLTFLVGMSNSTQSQKEAISLAWTSITIIITMITKHSLIDSRVKSMDRLHAFLLQAS